MGITYSDLIIRALTRDRDRIAFVQDGKETSYAAAADLVGRIGRVLAERGLRPGQEVLPDELIALVRGRKGPIAAPKAVEFIDTIPLTPVGKADKRALRARYWSDEQRSVH